MVGISYTSGTGSGFSTLRPIDPSSMFYERRASTLMNPVPADTIDYEFFDYPISQNRALCITAIGTSQHDLASYNWYIDGQYFDPVSGGATVGTIRDPLKFPAPIKVRSGIKLLVSNYDVKPFPNPEASSVADSIPFECVVIGYWE